MSERGQLSISNRSFLVFNALFGSFNHFGKYVLHLVPKQKRKKIKTKMSLADKPKKSNIGHQNVHCADHLN